jgi:DNA-binding CsgD family transcriptional regulator
MGCCNGRTSTTLSTRLTPREREVAGLLAQDKAQCEIARELVISRRTAYVHVRRVVEKVGARSVMEAVVVLARGGTP